MDASTLATTVVRIITAIATRPPGDDAAGSVARELYEFVRNNIAGSARGRQVLEQFEQHPGEPLLHDALRDTVAGLVRNDPDLSQRLERMTARYHATQGGAGTITGDQRNLSVNTVSGVRGRNQISIGPMTITNNRQARISLAVVGVVVVLLLGWGAYGVVNVFTGGSGGTPAGAEPAEHAAAGVAPDGSSPQGSGSDAGRATHESVDLRYTPSLGDPMETHFDVTIQFGQPGSDTTSCNFAPPPGTTTVPFTLTTVNRNTTGNLDTVPQTKIRSLAPSAIVYLASPSCEPLTDTIYGFWPGPRQERTVDLVLVGVPRNALATAGVEITFGLVNPLRSESDPPPTEKVVRATA
ncbi:hypothetical protein [Gandjariella thermophila]|uniref:Uncharacterized protein n=1 Tax=Gandjariella thermophila TaxID=1931992 RepID=A0A4D4J2Z9_9PSEU|nr:hypothetical protein [Gandjariella thermophila]GDY29009.1 hypothetical protein GTS_06420 [Gandjariella thermophila]